MLLYHLCVCVSHFVETLLPWLALVLDKCDLLSAKQSAGMTIRMGDLAPFGTSVKAWWAAESHRYAYIFGIMLDAYFCTTSVPPCHVLPKPCHLGLQNLAQPRTSLRAPLRRHDSVVSIGWVV